jgi:hypothetical protein
MPVLQESDQHLQYVCHSKLDHVTEAALRPMLQSSLEQT